MDAPAIEGRIVGAEVLAQSVPLRRLLYRAAPESSSDVSQRPALLTREVLLLRLRGEDGSVGIGEASAVDWLSPHGGDDVLLELTALAEQIVANRPPASALLQRSLQSSLSSTTRAGLQCALLDLQARRRGISMARLLGASSDGSLDVSALLTGDANAAEEAACYADEGYRAVKIKVGGAGVAGDLAKVLAIRAAVGSRCRLRLDANGTWSAAQARQALREMQQASIDFIEEPVGQAQPDRLVVLRALRELTAVAVDESIRCGRDLDDVLDANAADVLVIKLERVGGPLAALALSDCARCSGLRVVFTDSIESEVGRAATAHVALAANCAEPLGLGGAFFLDADVASMRAGGAPIAGPHFEIRGPGLGIELA